MNECINEEVDQFERYESTSYQLQHRHRKLALHNYQDKIELKKNTTNNEPAGNESVHGGEWARKNGVRKHDCVS